MYTDYILDVKVVNDRLNSIIFSFGFILFFSFFILDLGGSNGVTLHVTET